MGLFDWFRSKKGDENVAAAAAATQVNDTEGEKTTFVQGRLSAKAQSELRRLRQLKGEGATHYQWECTQFACFESKKFVTEGPYEISLGLVTVSPVPGRETNCDCDCVVARADESE